MLPCSLPPLTDADIQLLDAQRLERLRFCFKSLTRAALHISGLDRTLIISGGKEMALVLYERDALIKEAWLTAAATSIKIFERHQLIYDAETIYRSGWHKLKLKAYSGERAMAQATIIQDPDLVTSDPYGTPKSEQVIAPTKTATILRSMSLADIAADLEAQPDALQSFLEEQNATLIDFGGTILVPENEAAVAYEHYSLVRARQKMEERLAVLNAPAQKAHPTTNTVTLETKSKKNYLTWKGEFKIVKSSYKKTLQNALNALFPNAEVEQNQALNDICAQSDLGKAYIDKIARDPIYTDKARARENLLKAAGELAAQDQGSGEEEKVREAV